MGSELEQFGANIKRLRLARGLSQDDLAALCGYTSRTTVAKIEAGAIDIPQRKIKAFAAALHVSPKDILAAAPVEPLPEPMIEIEQITKDFDARQLSRLLEYAKMLKSFKEE